MGAIRRRRYTPEEIARLKALERENARLKRMLAERELEIGLLKEAIGAPGGSPLNHPLFPRRLKEEDEELLHEMKAILSEPGKESWGYRRMSLLEEKRLESEPQAGLQALQAPGPLYSEAKAEEKKKASDKSSRNKGN